MGFFGRRRMRWTCPQCHQRTLTRIQQREGYGGSLSFLSRFCVNCEYSDGHGWEMYPTSEDAAIEHARMFGDRYYRLSR